MEGEIWVLTCRDAIYRVSENKKTMSETTNENNTRLTLWNRVLATSVKMPFVKVDRDEFLNKERWKFCTTREVKTGINERPLKVRTKHGLAN